MRPLIFFTLVQSLNLISPTFAAAAVGLLKFDVGSSSSSQGSPLQSLLPSNPSSNLQEVKVSAQSPTLSKGFVLGASLSRQNEKNNIFRFAPPDLLGQEIALSDVDPGQKSKISVNISQSSGLLTWNLEHSQDIAKSLVAEKRWKGSLLFGSAESITFYGYEFQRAFVDQPASRYSHPVSFRTLDRPNRLSEERNSLFVEHILSEKWKIRGLVHYGRVSQTRPYYTGFELRQAYALTRSFFPQLSFGQLREAKGDPLEDDRGDAGHSWLDLGAYYQASGRWLLKGAFTNSIEEEKNRPGFGNSSANLIGYSAGMDYLLGRLKLQLNIRSVIGSRDFKDQSIQGGIQWELAEI